VGEGGGRHGEPVESELIEPVTRGFESDVIDARARQSVEFAVERNRIRGGGLPGRSKPGATMPIVPKLAALTPSRSQIWRRNTVTEVLPLVPVTAAIVLGCGA